MTGLPRPARVYWLAAVAVALTALSTSLVALVVSAPKLPLHVWLSIVGLAAIALLGEGMAIPLLTVDGESAAHSIGSVAAIAAVVVLPPYAAILLTPLAIAWSQRRRSSVKGLFNVAHGTISIAAATLVFRLAGGVPALYAHGPLSAFRALGAMLALSIVYHAAGSGMVSVMVGLVSGQRPWDVYRTNHWRTILQEATAIGLGLMLGGFWLYNAAFAPLVALPVAMAYFSIDTFVRIQEETREAVLAMARSIDLRDPGTRLHSTRVARLSVALAKQLDLSHEQVANIELSALVHDIGKIGIPNEILNKPGKLTQEERSQMEAHPIIGHEMLRHYKQFRRGLGIVRWHHERWDGAGYPDKLPGNRIPLDARIVSVADAFEAMTADRPYRTAMSVDIAYARLVEAAGSQFDPHLVVPFKAALLETGEWAATAKPVTPAAEALPLPRPIVPHSLAPSFSQPHVIRPVRARREHAIRRLRVSGSCRTGPLAAAEGEA